MEQDRVFEYWDEDIEDNDFYEYGKSPDWQYGNIYEMMYCDDDDRNWPSEER